MTDFKPFDCIGLHAYGEPSLAGKIKVRCEDFFVSEHLNFELTEEGEHIYCFVEKHGLDTEQVAKVLATESGVSVKQVNYAGLKDKHAVTQQWFSIRLPGKFTPNLEGLSHPQIKILKQSRHLKKLQRGNNTGNYFEIIVRDVQGNQQDLSLKIKKIKQGVPNYFGLQRFGYNGRNLSLAHQVFFENKKIKNRLLKGLIYSAVRSWLFNIQLSQRIKNDTWQRIEPGDLVGLSGSQSVFICDDVDRSIDLRLTQRDISPVGLLWGDPSDTRFESVYSKVYRDLSKFTEWLDSLKNHNLKMMYRSFITYPENLVFDWLDDTSLKLSFFLSKGSYATALIRELFVF